MSEEKRSRIQLLQQQVNSMQYAIDSCRADEITEDDMLDWLSIDASQMLRRITIFMERSE